MHRKYERGTKFPSEELRKASCAIYLQFQLGTSGKVMKSEGQEKSWVHPMDKSVLEILELLWQPLHRNSAWENGNKVEFTIKLSLLTLLPILLTAVMAVIIALLTLFYPQRALRPWKIIPCAKPQTHLRQMGFHEGYLFFPWGGQAVTVLQRLQKRSWFVLKRDRTRRLSVLAHLYNSWARPVLHPGVWSGFCPL